MAEELHNPKLDEHPGSNTEKNPHDGVSGDDPMTGEQASYPTTLCKEAGEELPPERLTKAAAAQRVNALKGRLARGGSAMERESGRCLCAIGSTWVRERGWQYV